MEFGPREVLIDPIEVDSLFAAKEIRERTQLEN